MLQKKCNFLHIFYHFLLHFFIFCQHPASTCDAIIYIYIYTQHTTGYNMLQVACSMHVALLSYSKRNVKFRSCIFHMTDIHTSQQLHIECVCYCVHYIYSCRTVLHNSRYDVTMLRCNTLPCRICTTGKSLLFLATSFDLLLSMCRIHAYIILVYVV